MLKASLQVLYESEEYKDEYDKIAVIRESDAGLGVEDISPNLCSAKEAKALMKMLNKAPRQARTLKKQAGTRICQ